MIGVTMVGDFSSDAFTHDKLLTERLASCAILGMAAPVVVGILLLSMRTLYRFIDSNTGVLVMLVTLRAGETEVMGIFKCVVNKTGVTRERL